MSWLCSIRQDIPVILHIPGAYGQCSVVSSSRWSLGQDMWLGDHYIVMDWAHVLVIIQCQTDGSSLSCKDDAVVWQSFGQLVVGCLTILEIAVVQWNARLCSYGPQTWNHSLSPLLVGHLLPAVNVSLRCPGSPPPRKQIARSSTKGDLTIQKGSPKHVAAGTPPVGTPSAIEKIMSCSIHLVQFNCVAWLKSLKPNDAYIRQ